ncbi:hypothetical protein GMMP15_660018 [Candidatus Magnetomoraceae bacterium gMMP-15]
MNYFTKKGYIQMKKLDKTGEIGYCDA